MSKRQGIRISVATTPVALALLATGCLSTSTYRTAEPVAEGEREVGLALEIDTVVGDDDWDDTVLTHPRLHARRGFAENMDFGLTAGIAGTGFDINALLVEEGSLALSLNPSQSFAFVQDFGDDDDFFDLEFSRLHSTTVLGVLADARLSDNATLTGGFKPGLFFSSVDEGDSRDNEAELFLAGSVGLELGIGDDMHIFPELNIARVVTGDAPEWPEDGTFIKFGVALGF